MHSAHESHTDQPPHAHQLGNSHAQTPHRVTDQAVLSYAQEGGESCGSGEGAVGLVMLHATRMSPEDVWYLTRHLSDLSDQTEGRLIVDVEHVFPLDCTWLDALLSLHQHCVTRHGMLVLVGLPGDALDMLIASGVAGCLCLADHHDDAMQRVRRVMGSGTKGGVSHPRQAA
jgi:anti-anti-sigma regulatory factor